MPNAKRGTNARVSARKVLEGATAYIGADVIVVGRTRTGELTVAQSLPTRDVEDIDAAIALLKEGVGKLQGVRRKIKAGRG